MRWATSRLGVFFTRSCSAGLQFRGVGFLVIGQFCVGDEESRGRRMICASSQLPVKPERADIRCVLIAHSMRHESIVRNGHKVFTECAARTAEGEGIFTNRPVALKPNVLQDKRITHKDPPFRNTICRKSDLGALTSREDSKGTKGSTFMMAQLSVSVYDPLQKPVGLPGGN